MASAVLPAFITVVLIWSTTPLTIAWSGEGVGFLFGVASRMTLGAVFAAALLWLLRIRFDVNRRALLSYFVAGLGIYWAMVSIYWAATLIPSGWIAVIFGTSAVFTGIMAHYILHEHLSLNRMLGLALSLVGLAIIFYESTNMDYGTLAGVAVTLFGTIGQSSTAVWLKKINYKQHGLALTTGGLLFAAPMYLLTWLVFDGSLPTDIPIKAGLSILYLALFGSVLGFSLYYYLIHATQASKVALITLITPVTALLVGAWLNNEAITMTVVWGTAFILLGLSFYQWGERWLRRG